MKNILARIMGVLLGSIIVVAQTPAPASYRLNPEASKTFAQIDQAQTELRRQFLQLEGQRTTLLIGAGVPEDSRECAAGGDGIVVCTKPKPAASPAATK